MDLYLVRRVWLQMELLQSELLQLDLLQLDLLRLDLLRRVSHEVPRLHARGFR